MLKFLIKKITSNNPTPKATDSTEKIVACSQCGLHVPESESMVTDGQVRCNNPTCQL